ncbi:unnamed protein product [Lota lota]
MGDLGRRGRKGVIMTSLATVALMKKKTGQGQTWQQVPSGGEHQEENIRRTSGEHQGNIRRRTSGGLPTEH